MLIKTPSDLFHYLFQDDSKPPFLEERQNFIKIMELDPLFEFFRLNFPNPSSQQIAENLDTAIHSIKHHQKKLKKRAEKKGFHVGIKLDSPREVPLVFKSLPEEKMVYPLWVSANVPFTTQYFYGISGLTSDVISIFLDDFEGAIPSKYMTLSREDISHWNSEELKRFKNSLNQYNSTNLEVRHPIHSLPIKNPICSIYDNWAYKHINFYIDNKMRFYMTFVYQGITDNMEFFGFTPIPKELVGKFRYYSECMSAHYNVFITNEFP